MPLSEASGYSEVNLMDISIGSDAETHRTPPQTPSEGEGELFLSPGQPPKTGALSFSIDNILRPDFGSPKPEPLVVGCPKTPDSTDEGGSLSPGSLQDMGLSPQPQPALWPAWVYCTRYSDRPSAGPRTRKLKRKASKPDEKRPRTAFTGEQLARLKTEFQENRYLTEKRRQDLANDLGLKESQIKIWFQNKRAKIKKQTGSRNPLALQLMAQGLYNHASMGNAQCHED